MVTRVFEMCYFTARVIRLNTSALKSIEGGNGAITHLPKYTRRTVLSICKKIKEIIHAQALLLGVTGCGLFLLYPYLDF